MAFRSVIVLALFVSSAFAANVSKLKRQCEQHNLQACNKLAEIAKTPKEHGSDRVEAIFAIDDQKLLTDLSVSDPNQYIKSAAIRRLNELIAIDFLSAIDEGDVGRIRTLAGKGAEIDPHGSVTDVDQVQAVAGGFEYRFVSRRGASSVMLRAIRSGHEESVRALVELGANVRTEFFNNDMNLGFTSMLSLRTIMDSVSLGLPVEIRGAGGADFRVSRDGTVFSSFRPKPASKASYLSLAEHLPASTKILDLLREHSAEPKNYAADDYLSSGIDGRAKHNLKGTMLQQSGEVTLDVGVLLEKTHQFIPNLKSSNFRLYEDGVEQKITDFELAGAKYKLVYYSTKSKQDEDDRKLNVELVDAVGKPLLMQDEKHQPLRYEIQATERYTGSPVPTLTPSPSGGDVPLATSGKQPSKSTQKLRCTSAGDPVGYAFLVDYDRNTAQLLSVAGVELKVTSVIGDDIFAFDAVINGQVREKFIIVRKDLSFKDTPLQSTFPIAMSHLGTCVAQP